MNTLDWIFIVVLALMGIRCMIKGFISEILSVAAVLVGLFAGLLLYKSVGAIFVGWGLPATPAVLPGILGFAAAFAIAYLVVKLLERLLREGLEAAELGGVDRALGFVLGLAEGLAVVALILVAMQLLQPIFKSVSGYAGLLEGSAFARVILPIIGPEVIKATRGIKMETPELKLTLPAVKKP